MNIFLANDTGDTNNPGCQATIMALENLIHKSGDAIVHRTKVGYGKDIFPNCYKKKFCRFSLPFRQKPAWDWVPDAVDINKWKNCIKILARDMEHIWEHIDVLLINGEGTLHHNQPASLALLALVYIAKKQEKKVWLINTTMQQMDYKLLCQVLPLCDFIAAREPQTCQYLSSHGFNIESAADLAWLISVNKLSLPAEEQRKRCLYTPGVLTDRNTNQPLSAKTVIIHLNELHRYNWQPTFLAVEEEDREIAAFVSKKNIPIIKIGSISYREIDKILKNYSMIISGRYHILLFACLKGIPVIPMQSNSWKIEGLMESLECNRKPVRCVADLKSWLNHGPFTPKTRLTELMIGRARNNYPSLS
jgi:polysaccharide pyruvyl transferase WcaK-like protein